MSDRIISTTEFDVLGDVLETLRFRGSVFFHSELAAPWGLALPPLGVPRFHVNLAGNCFVGNEQGEVLEVEAMSIVMLPTGNSHWIADQPGRELVASDRASEACELGDPLFQQGEITNRLICGLVRFDLDSPHPLLDSLPDLLHFPMLEPKHSIWATVELIDAEMTRNGREAGRIVDRLTEVLFLQLLNYYLEQNQELSGFFGALRDRRLQRALALIHSDPGFDWTLDALGERVGMSRATLVRHFQDTMGVAPMAYLADWRMVKAYNLIRYSSAPIDVIAEQVGYASGRSLSKMFRRRYDCTPKDLRRALK